MNLLEKYNVPGPRYTSYPTVPFWQDTPPTGEEWIQAIQARQEEGSGKVSVYIHLPYCEKLCTFCGCNTRITINHNVEAPYIDAVLREWNKYRGVFADHSAVDEVHLGGGTPTFFAPSQLSRLMQGLKDVLPFSETAALSFEANPNTTTEAHLEVLYNLGFRRISFGIQDFDRQVQEVIRRVQTFEQVRDVVNKAREIGYESINFDLIYGLPCQSMRSILDTVEKTVKLAPDRLAFYSYAHIPKIKPAQRLYEDLLPSKEEKFGLYQLGKNALEAAGYQEVGMDHFSLKEDDLYRAGEEGRLHRNFMGYSTHPTEVQVGLGTSAIGDAWGLLCRTPRRWRPIWKERKRRDFTFLMGMYCRRKTAISDLIFWK